MSRGQSVNFCTALSIKWVDDSRWASVLNFLWNEPMTVSTFLYWSLSLNEPRTVSKFLYRSLHKMSQWQSVRFCTDLSVKWAHDSTFLYWSVYEMSLWQSVRFCTDFSINEPKWAFGSQYVSILICPGNEPIAVDMSLYWFLHEMNLRRSVRPCSVLSMKWESVCLNCTVVSIKWAFDSQYVWIVLFCPWIKPLTVIRLCTVLLTKWAFNNQYSSVLYSSWNEPMTVSMFKLYCSLHEMSLWQSICLNCTGLSLKWAYDSQYILTVLFSQ